MWREVKDCRGVNNVLILVCLTLVTLPSASSGPINMDRMNSKMKWINPCDTNPGGEVSENVGNSEFNSSELVKIIGDATSAIITANQFIGDFTQHTFGKEMGSVHNDFKNVNLTWLGTDWLGKHFNESITADHLETLKLDDVLVNVYTILQKLAVGLEQITWDQHDNKDKFETNFNDSELYLKRVLCELYNVIEAHGLKMPENVTRDIMSQDDRDTKNDSGKRKIRDWVIFRDYINTLQFLQQALEHLMKNLSDS